MLEYFIFLRNFSKSLLYLIHSVGLLQKVEALRNYFNSDVLQIVKIVGDNIHVGIE